MLPAIAFAPEKEQLRFEHELEFVQMLANAQYLHFLARKGYFLDHAFLGYLRYLRYWRQPKYAQHISYPLCLDILDLLCTSQDFREKLLPDRTSFEKFRRIIATEHIQVGQRPFRQRLRVFAEAQTALEAPAADTNDAPLGEP
jgi:mediator of RNA polymerase II transcription subunit 31